MTPVEICDLLMVVHCRSGDPAAETVVFDLRFGVVVFRDVTGLADDEVSLLKARACALMAAEGNSELDLVAFALLRSYFFCTSGDSVVPSENQARGLGLPRSSSVSRSDLPPAREEPFALGLVIFCPLNLVYWGTMGLRRVASIEVSADPKLEIES